MGAVQRLAGGDASKLRLHFDAQQLRIPDLNWRTASVFGVPIPPPLNIAIRPSKFEVCWCWADCVCVCVCVRARTCARARVC
jgi:hypothetical protein